MKIVCEARKKKAELWIDKNPINPYKFRKFKR